MAKDAVKLSFFPTCLFLGLLFSAHAFAFLYEIPILDKNSIRQLKDEALMDAYIDAMIELEAANTFYIKAGFLNAKEYKQYKELLRYRVNLLMEFKKRSLPLPQIYPD